MNSLFGGPCHGQTVNTDYEPHTLLGATDNNDGTFTTHAYTLREYWKDNLPIVKFYAWQVLSNEEAWEVYCGKK